MKRISGSVRVVDQLKHFFQTAFATYMPHLSIDSVIFSFHKSKLKVLLIRFGETEHFLLPGGFVKHEESLDDAAERILGERTGIDQVYLEQFYTSGAAMRSDTVVIETLSKMLGGLDPGHFLDQRFVSVCYYALIEYSKVSVKPGLFDLECKWVNLEDVPGLLFDHNKILDKALTRLQEDLEQKQVGFRLLHDPFTMRELQQLYESVHRKTFVRTNFQRRMLGMNILRRLDKKYTGKSNKAPYTYKFEQNQ